jgi:hypothetical protein
MSSKFMDILFRSTYFLFADTAIKKPFVHCDENPIKIIPDPEHKKHKLQYAEMYNRTTIYNQQLQGIFNWCQGYSGFNMQLQNKHKVIDNDFRIYKKNKQVLIQKE